MKKSYLNSERNSAVSLKPSKTIRLLLMVLFVCLFENVATAATFTSTVTGGNWATGATWVGGSVPGNGDDVRIANGATVTVATNATCKSLTFLGTSTISNALTVNSNFTLTVTNGVTVNSCNTTTGFNTACAISGGGTLTCASLLVGTDFGTTTTATLTTTLTSTITNLNVTGNLTAASFIGTSNARRINSAFNFASGTLNIGGVITTTNENSVNNSTFTNSSGASIGVLLLSNISPFKTAASGTSTIVLNGTETTVNYTGTAQTIRATTYNNLTLSGSGTKSLAGNITVNKDITIDTGVTLDITTFDLDVSGNIILNGTCESSTVKQSDKGKVAWNPGLLGATLYGNNGTFSNIDQLETNGNIIIDSSATITFNNASIDGNGIDGNGGTITNKGIVNVTGTRSFAIEQPLTWNNIGTLNYGLSTIPVTDILTLNASASGNTVNYNGTGTAENQNIIPSTYDNLTLSGSGIKTFGAATTINNTLSIATGVSANLGGNNYEVGILILGGAVAAPGSWGSLSSSANNKDDNYFAPNTSGTVNAKPATPSATITQPDCKTAKGSVVLTGLQSSGTLIQKDALGFVTDSYTYTGNSQTISSLIVGTYYFEVKVGLRTSSPRKVIIEEARTNTWTTRWSEGTPNKTQALVFDGDYSENIDIVGCSCTVNALTDVTIKTGLKMTITNEISVDVDGFLTFEDNSSLVQINNAPNINTGDIDYIRTTDKGIYNTDYVYWSSPVEGMTLGMVSKNLTISDKYYSYEPTATGEDWKQESSLTPMVSGNGYIIRGPETSATVLPGDKYTATFSGVPHNGHYEITPIYANKSYLLGNPYPSALDADTFLANNAAVLNGTLYFWTHNTDMQARGLILSTAGSGAYAYTSNDYATYNATGGVGASPSDPGAITAGALVGGPNPRGDNNANPPSGKIASGQGFFASSKLTIPANSKIVFDNTMRVGVIDIAKEDNTQFFKTRNPNGKTAKTKAIEKNRIWLNMTNSEGAFKQTLVGYLTDATNDYDDRFDGESFDGNEFIDFYSLNQDLNLTIQGRALPFDEKDEVPLGYRTTIDGAFTINIAQADGLLTNQAVFIEDKLTNTLTDLKKGNYTFNTAAGTFNERFVLKYSNKTLSVDATDKEDGILAFYSNNYKTLIIRNNLMDATVNSVALFNMLGQNIDNWDVSESEQTNVQVPIKNITSGIYIVKVKTTKGESSKKIIVN